MVIATQRQASAECCCKVLCFEEALENECCPHSQHTSKQTCEFGSHARPPISLEQRRSQLDTKLGPVRDKLQNEIVELHRQGVKLRRMWDGCMDAAIENISLFLPGRGARARTLPDQFAEEIELCTTLSLQRLLDHGMQQANFRISLLLRHVQTLPQPRQQGQQTRRLRQTTTEVPHDQIRVILAMNSTSQSSHEFLSLVIAVQQRRNLRQIQEGGCILAMLACELGVVDLMEQG
mmetsp:Transcript_56371/g.180986  ORF Transcript_56371/g.180986 Transcript_56371/m.180986 type:complete len:235 (-) Transcript_56371:248-952(-)